jgi:hypothetical protein
MLSCNDTTAVHWPADAHATSRGEVSLRRRLLQPGKDMGKDMPMPDPVPIPSSSSSTSVSAVRPLPCMHAMAALTTLGRDLRDLAWEQPAGVAPAMLRASKPWPQQDTANIPTELALLR